MRKRCQSLEAGIPALHVGPGRDLVGRDIALRLPPVVGIHHLSWISGGSQYLRNQRIRIQGDWGDQLFQLLGIQRLRRGLPVILLRILLTGIRIRLLRAGLLLVVLLWRRITRLLAVGLLLGIGRLLIR